MSTPSKAEIKAFQLELEKLGPDEVSDKSSQKVHGKTGWKYEESEKFLEKHKEQKKAELAEEGNKLAKEANDISKQSNKIASCARIIAGIALTISILSILVALR